MVEQNKDMDIHELLADEEIIHLVKIHIERHKHHIQAAFSIAGIKRLVELAEIGKQMEKENVSKALPTRCTGLCLTGDGCDCGNDGRFT